MPRLGVDFDLGAVRDPGGGAVRTDHGRETELAGDDGRVAHRPAFFDHERSEHRQQRVDRRAR